MGRGSVRGRGQRASAAVWDACVGRSYPRRSDRSLDHVEGSAQRPGEHDGLRLALGRCRAAEQSAEPCAGADNGSEAKRNRVRLGAGPTGVAADRGHRCLVAELRGDLVDAPGRDRLHATSVTGHGGALGLRRALVEPFGHLPHEGVADSRSFAEALRQAVAAVLRGLCSFASRPRAMFDPSGCAVFLGRGPLRLEGADRARGCPRTRRTTDGRFRIQPLADRACGFATHFVLPDCNTITSHPR